MAKGLYGRIYVPVRVVNVPGAVSIMMPEAAKSTCVLRDYILYYSLGLENYF